MGSPRRTRAGTTRESLIEAHLPLVQAVARRYAGQGVELDDLIQVGALGLVKASDRFDPGQGVTFAAFATPTIEGEIRHHLRDRAATVRLPRRVQRLAGEARRREAELTATLGRQPTTAELARELAADEADVTRALAARTAGQALPLGEDLDADRAPASAAATEPSQVAEDRLLVEGRLRVLDDRERQIVYLRYHADLTERQIGRELAISQAHVSRLLAGALKKLRAAEESAAAAPAPASPATADTAATAATADNNDNDNNNGSSPPSDGAPAPPSHSGRFLVRMSSELHRALAREAERRHVSLNRLVTDTLAGVVSHDTTGAGTDPPPSEPERRSLARAFRVVLAANVIVIAFAAALAIVLLVLAIERGL